MILSVFVYSFMMMTTYFIGSLYNRSPKVILFFLVFIFVLFSGIRYDVGVDYFAYKNLYESVLYYGNIELADLGREDLEVGFVWLCHVLAFIKSPYAIFFMACAAIQIIPIFYAFRNESYLFRYIIFLMIASGQYFFFMNGMRQGIAFSFFVCALSFLKDKKWLWVVIYIYLASLFHTSIIFLIPIVLLFVFKQALWVGNRWLRVVLILLSFMLPSILPIQSLMSMVDGAIVLIGYTRYEDVEELLVEQSLNFGPRSIISLLQGILVAYYANNIEKKYDSIMFLMVFNLSFIGICLTPSFVFSRTLMRFTMYFTLFQFIVDSYLCAYLASLKRWGLLFFFMLLVSFYLWITLYVSTGRDSILWHFVPLS